MEPTELLHDLDARLAEVAPESRGLVVAAAVGYAINRIEQWESDADRERALKAILAAACDALEAEPEPESEARTGADWVGEFFTQAKQSIIEGVPVLLPNGGVVTIDSHRYDILRAEARPGGTAVRRLVFTVQLTNDDRYDANFWSATFRLTHADQASAPTNSLNEVVPGRTTRTAEVEFTLPAEVTEATLVVGDDPVTAVALPVVLAG